MNGGLTYDNKYSKNLKKIYKFSALIADINIPGDIRVSAFQYFDYCKRAMLSIGSFLSYKPKSILTCTTKYEAFLKKLTNRNLSFNNFILTKFHIESDLCFIVVHVINEWKKREVINHMETIQHPNILSYIAGRKNDISLVKVFLRHEDKDTVDFFRNKCSLDNVKFINVSKVFGSMPKKSREIQTNDSLMEEKEREQLSFLIKMHREKLMAMHSTIVGLGLGTKMLKENERVPCIVIHCLDKSLIPFGEQPLPKSIDGFLVDIRENFVCFGYCLNCMSLRSGCAIGRRSNNSAGSVGFIVRSKHHSNFEQHGFLTAAHVAIEKFYELYFRKTLLSKDVLNGTKHEIVHPPMTDRVIGNVVESFCGNYGHQCRGMDAAFVTVNDEKLRGKYCPNFTTKLIKTKHL